jgi:hypothetical protein
MMVPRVLLLLASFCLSSLAASANVITDWDEKAVALLQPRFVPPVAYRAMAIIELAMFEAVNSRRSALPALQGRAAGHPRYVAGGRSCYRCRHGHDKACAGCGDGHPGGVDKLSRGAA